jgi:hypothetical protein
VRLGRLAVLLSPLLLLMATTWRIARLDLSDLPLERRYWEDITVAASRALPLARRAAPSLEVPDIGSHQELRHALQRYLLRAVAERRIETWQFWRTVQVRRSLRSVPLRVRGSDDSGRSTLLALAFRPMGAVAPALPLWLGVFFAAPVLAWAVAELAAARLPVAGAALGLACAAAPFYVEALSLSYSGVGFYLTAIILVVALATYAALGECQIRGLLVRSAGAGIVFAVCVLCRASTFLMLPGLALALALAAWRARAPWSRHPRSGRGLLLAAALVVLLAPYAAIRPPQQHEVWLGVWEGLGDFDRSKGHAWSDTVAKAVLRSEGIRLDRGAPVWVNAVQNEPLFRRRVLQSIREDPVWYAGILAKRLAVTVTQWKLWPWTPLSGRSTRPARFFNEGATDTYYRMTTTADFIGLPGWALEMPVPLLLLPGAVLLAGWALGAHLRVPAAAAGILACTAFAALGLPVVVTTAGGLETEGFMLVHHLGLALAAQEVASRWAERQRDVSAGHPLRHEVGGDRTACQRSDDR